MQSKCKCRNEVTATKIHSVGMCKRVVKGIVVGMRGGSLFENEAFPYSASQQARAALTVNGYGEVRAG
jgi:hypothetical protein